MAVRIVDTVVTVQLVDMEVAAVVQLIDRVDTADKTDTVVVLPVDTAVEFVATIVLVLFALPPLVLH